MKRAVLVLSVLTTFAGFAAGCGPEEKYCYDQHTTCKQARDLEEGKERDRIEKERMRLEAGMGGLTDGGSIVLD
jgi:hypothetical protein